jgi:hypothetical protein
MDGTCSAHGWDEKCIHYFGWNTGGDWKINIIMDLREIGCDDVDWIHWAQDCNQWRTLVNR